MKIITRDISTDFIRLDAFLKLTGAAPSGGQAKAWIQSGRIRLDRAVCTQRGHKLHAGDVVMIDEEQTSYRVGKAGEE